MEINPRVGVRADVRRRRRRARSGWRACAPTAASSISSRRIWRTCRAASGRSIEARLDEYLDHVREIERRIQRTETAGRHAAGRAGRAGRRARSRSRSTSALMFDLLALAYQADLTRVFTFMMAREVSQRTYPQIGVTEPHHSISHHGNKPDKIAGAREDQHLPHAAVREVPASGCARRRTATASLLDHSLIVYGSGMSNGNGHTPSPLPLAVVGGRGSGQRRSPSDRAGTDADREPPAGRRRQVRRGRRALRRQHRPAGTVDRCHEPRRPQRPQRDALSSS